MTLNRRRFLAITAAATALPCASAAGTMHTWRGTALGAECEITLHASSEIARPALSQAQQLLDHVEAQFSLYRADSALNLLNSTGFLAAPDPSFLALMALSDRAHDLTEGAFDPSIQPLWQALAGGGGAAAARALVDWGKVSWDAERIMLGPSQRLSFNGIAQGFATDLICNAFADLGLDQALVNIGEFRGLGGPWRIGLADPDHGHIGTRTLRSGAIATSSPNALRFAGGEAHILHPQGRGPLWATVSVEAETAALADALSTAFCCLDLETLRSVRARLPELRLISLLDRSGDLWTI